MPRPKKRTKVVRRRLGSKAQRIDNFVLPYVATHKGTPSSISLYASKELKERVTRQDVWNSLHENMYTRKTSSPVISRSVESERLAHLYQLPFIWTHLDQVR